MPDTGDSISGKSIWWVTPAASLTMVAHLLRLSGTTDEKAAKLGRKLVDMGLFQPSLDKPWVKRFKSMMKAATGREGEPLNWDGGM